MRANHRPPVVSAKLHHELKAVRSARKANASRTHQRCQGHGAGRPHAEPRGHTKTTEQEDPALTPRGHTRSTTTHRVSAHEDGLKATKMFSTTEGTKKKPKGDG